jgi:hypothetical protein
MIRIPSPKRIGAGVTVKWDTPSEQSILYNEMAQFERVPEKNKCRPVGV